VLDDDKHTAWHRDIEARVVNVDRNLSAKYDTLASKVRELDRRADWFGQAIDKISKHFKLEL
jgi:hypothetical protein